ncbi:2OG-Fe(II) oxygenase [Legionella cardiaca]|uniref:2OG-Fe(II) oxygenase n=1 Tax=Legionella cardiaca TaxID=1071983 RepID=A0ABY8ARB7_9GAMM|nr:2OG-Fe(II) oxygenase [Legionella cardiaca]WED42070.1 2OG-Fe(II) oxygenase [Legionella cardiaca]
MINSRDLSMKAQLTDLVIQRLSEAKEQLKKDFSRAHPIKVARHFVLDNFLPTEIAEKIYADFPKPGKMHLLSHHGELKLKYSHLRDTSSLIQDINFAIQDPRVVAIVEEITQIKNQIPDPSRFAGGISMLLKGYYINPHVDNSHDVDRKFYRAVNVLYYVSPNWQETNGGNYELWDESVENRIVVPCLFNRLLVMETNRTSWHSVNRVVTDMPRCCVFNYFFSEHSPEGKEYLNMNSLFNPLYRPRPEQKFRRGVALVKDSLLKGFRR